MPEDFLKCQRDGGRIRTKLLPGGKFIRICFDKNGKSHSGEVMTKKENGMELSIQTRILEKKIYENKRTIVAGILEGDTLSANKRFYPLRVVESIKESLVGLKSMIGHDTDSPEDVVATITSSAMSGKRLIGSFKFGTDEKSNMMFTKIKEGLIDSVSIRASGETKPGKINNENVDIVDSLKVWSVDLVVEGGVESAKVMQVFEKAPTIEYLKESETNEAFDACVKDGGKMSMKDAGNGMSQTMCSINGQDNKDPVMNKVDAEKMMSKHESGRLQMEKEMQEKLDKAMKENEVLRKDKETLEASTKKAELDAYKTQKLSTIEDKDIRSDVSENLTGDSKEAIDISFNKLKKLAEGVAKKSCSKIVMEPVKEGAEEEFKTLNDVFESKSVDKKEKLEVLSAMLNGKV